MKWICSYILVLASLAAFGQERFLLEIPQTLNSIQVEFPEMVLPKIDNPNKPVGFVDGIRLYCYINIPKEAIIQTEIFSNGLHAQYEGLLLNNFSMNEAAEMHPRRLFRY